MIVNVHERQLPASPEQVGALLDRSFTADDCLWPAARWPMSRSGELRVGAACHHDDVRYTVTEYQPGQRVWFAFTDIDLHGGDLLVLGGPSRLAYHGVPQTHPNTGDAATGLAHGRINITMRVTGRTDAP